MLRVWMILLGVTMVAAIVVEQSTEQTPEVPRHFCGRALANARFLYCYQSAEKKAVRRPTIMGSVFGRKEPDVWSWSRHYTDASARQDHSSVLRTTRRKRLGIADECCLKPCYISELLNYC